MYGRVADDSDDNLSKVPFSFKRVSSPFTGETLSKELITEISEIKKMSRSVAQNVLGATKKYQQGESQHPANMYKKLSKELKVIKFPHC